MKQLERGTNPIEIVTWSYFSHHKIPFHSIFTFLASEVIKLIQELSFELYVGDNYFKCPPPLIPILRKLYKNILSFSYYIISPFIFELFQLMIMKTTLNKVSYL